MIYIVLITTHNIDYVNILFFFMQYEYQNIIAKIKKDDWSSIIFFLSSLIMSAMQEREETHVTTR